MEQLDLLELLLLKGCKRPLFKIMVCIEINTSLCLCRLNFDNSAYRYIMKEDEEEQEILPITSDFFFEVFPFNIVFRQVTLSRFIFLNAQRAVHE